MVLMELKHENQVGATKRWIPLLLLLIGALLVVISHKPGASILSPGETHRRTLEPEEREAVLFDLERIGQEDPALTSASQSLAERLSLHPENRVEVSVANSSHLIEKHDNEIVFAERFFQADAGTQEVALKQSLGERVATPSEIAIAPAE
jgi:hypothetical protein